jgi:predicted O-methyltransferase YrrM
VDDGHVKPIDTTLLERIDRYIEQLFAPEDDTLRRNTIAAQAAGMPAINVSAAQGKLLYILTKIAGARRVLEIGTLGGYSTTWLARALPAGGRVVSLELDPEHATVARESVEGVAPGVTIDIRVGDAAAALRAMIDARDPPFDVVFIDADKPRYVDYLDLVLPLSRPGTVVLADNLIRHGLVLDAATDDASAQGARAYNAAIAAHPRLESIVLPILRDTIDGLSISLVKDAAAAPVGRPRRV